MNDTTAPYYGVWADELNLIFEEVEFSLAVFISLKVTQVSHVTVACARATVMLPKGIEMRRQAVASIVLVSEIAKFMNVKSMLAIRCQAVNAAKDLSLRLSIFLSRLKEPHIALCVILT